MVNEQLGEMIHTVVSLCSGIVVVVIVVIVCSGRVGTIVSSVFSSSGRLRSFGGGSSSSSLGVVVIGTSSFGCIVVGLTSKASTSSTKTRFSIILSGQQNNIQFGASPED